MTREEACRLAMRACEETWNEKTCKQIKEALEKEPCEEELDFVQKHKKISCNLIVEPCNDCISRQAAQEKISNLINEMETIFSDIREKLVDDSVCGLCEYDCDHGIDGCANECPGFERDDCFKLKEEYRNEWNDLSGIPSVTPKQKTGHWIVLSPTDMYCSECNEIEHLDTSRKFCAYCGAKMQEVQK